MTTTTAERDALTTADGVAQGDFCLVEGTNLYVAITVTSLSSAWRAIAGVPTSGPVGLGGKNTADSTNRSVFVLSGVSFRAVLDTTPSSVTFAAVSNSNWPNLPSLITVTTTGFTLSGTSSSVTPNTNAWTRLTYTISY